MYLHILTVSENNIYLEINEEKSVYDLKLELSYFPAIGVHPEDQKLIYAGKVLNNEEILKSCIPDVSKIIVAIIQNPVNEANQVKNAVEKEEAAGVNISDEIKEDETREDTMKLVQQIVDMGYPENDARAALKASYNCPERAVEYLIEGNIPEKEARTKTSKKIESVLDLFRQDPAFCELKTIVRRNPNRVSEAINRLADSVPILSNLVSETRDEFIDVLKKTFENVSDDENE